MSELLKAENTNVSEAWLLCMEYLLTVGGSTSNLIVEIRNDSEIAGIRSAFNEFLSSHADKRLAPIGRVADTIFPADFYKGKPGQVARQHLYRMQQLAARVEHRFVGDSYFDRMIDWPYRLDGNPAEKTWNQLEYRICQLRKAWLGGKKTMNIAEIGLSSGLEDESLIWTGDIRTQHPFKDRTPIGFPCLSHISLTLFKGRLDLTAVYRNQHFITKAYGNYVGLMRLLRFLCAETGCAMGAVVCIATHADAELNKNGVSKAEINMRVRDCRRISEAAKS